MADYRCVILGHGQVAGELARKIATHPELPFQIVGFIFPSELGAFNAFSSVLEAEFTSVKTLGVLELLAQERIQKLIIALPQPMGVEVRKLISKCQAASIRVYLVPDWYDLYLSKAELEEVDGLPMVSLQERNQPATGFALKRIIDFVLSLGILILISPILAAAAFFVYSRKGRVFRSELRCGKGGIPFRMYRLNVERHAIGQFDRLLVRWSLSELPQLWNVLRGDMSLVGPRPESPEKVKHYSEWQRQRLKVRGGVTGLAQVNGLRDQHMSEDKARFDLQYIFNWSPLLDLTLILQTVWTVLFRGLRQEPGVSHVTNVPDAPRGYIEREVRDVNRS
jgi:lipopolysaccharide/colanic/teichoic acid biosynthesis glycosyltransferase